MNRVSLAAIAIALHSIAIRVGPKLYLGMKMRLDGRGEILVQIGTIVTASVYKKCRGAVDATPHATEKIAANLWREGAGRKRLAQLKVRNAEIAGEFEEQWRPEQLLIFVETIMHFPKPAVCSRDFGAFRR